MKQHSFAIKIVAFCAGLTATTALFAQQNTGKYPERTVQMIVPFGPGGTTDIMARLMQDELGKALGNNASVVIVNTAGAGGLIGMQNTARAKADGYTIAMNTTGPQTLQPARRDAAPYTPDQFDYVCGTYGMPVMAMVAQDSPYQTYSRALHSQSTINLSKL